MTKRKNWQAAVAAVLMFCCVAVYSFVPAPAYASGTMHVYGSEVTAAPGETVAMSFYVENNPGIASTILYFSSSSPQNISVQHSSDGKGVQLQTGDVFSKGSIFTNTVDGEHLVLWFTVNDIVKDGELFTVYFKVADDAAAGTYNVNVRCSQQDTANVNGDTFAPKMTAGKITVKADSSAAGGGAAGGTTGGSAGGTSGGSTGGTGSVSGGAGGEIKDETGGSGIIIDDSEFIDEEAEKKAFIADVKATTIKLSSKRTTLKGKKAIKLTWKLTGDRGITREDLDGFMVHRSMKKNKGYGTKPFYKTSKLSYTNSKSLKNGKSYYFKVRGYVKVDGKTYYTQWSNKAWRTIK